MITETPTETPETIDANPFLKKSEKDKGVCIIYLLTNTITNKRYVGQTWTTMEDRMGNKGVGYSNCTRLYNSIKKHGAENFHYTKMAICYNQPMANYLEDVYMEAYETRNMLYGYNLKEAGSNGRHSEETKKKISETLKAQIALLTPEELAQKVASIAGWWAGKERGPHTDEWKENNSKMMIERHATEGHPMQGKHHSEETKAKISEAGKGRKCSPESVKKRSEKRMMDSDRERAIVQAYQNDETIDKIEELLSVRRSCIYRVLDRNNIPLKGNHQKWTGKKHSEETKQKMAEARKKYWDSKRQDIDNSQ